MKVMLFGGDQRTVRLSELMIAAGHEVYAWGLDGLGLVSESPELAVGADLVILPYPAAKGDCIRAPFAVSDMTFEELFCLGIKAPVFGGGLTSGLRRKAAERGIRLRDYATEELLKDNAYLTAEGALGIAVDSLPRAVRGADILVVGCGRIGRELAVLLDAVGAKVSVSAQREESLAWIERKGFGVQITDKLSHSLGRFHMVFNTVPHAVMGEQEISATDGRCVLVELASQPGGIDAEAAERLGRRLICAPGLPGKTAPDSAAEIIYRETVKLFETEEI